MRIRIVFLLIFGYFQSYGQKSTKLIVSTSTLSNKQIIFCLIENNGMKLISKDTLTFSKNKLIFQKKINQPSCLASFSTIYKGKQLYSSFVIDSGIHELNLDVHLKPELKLVISALNTESYQIYNNISTIFHKNLNLYRNEINNKNVNTLSAGANKIFLLEELNYLQNHTNNFYALIALYQVSRTETDAIFANNVLLTLSKFSDNLKSSKLGQQILVERTYQINALKAAKSGKKVMTFTVMEANGNVFDSKSLNGQNYVIAFSATWCIPCLQQLPKLKKVYDAYKTRGLKVIYFNDDDDLEKWNKHIEAYKLDWINVSERQKAGTSKILKSFGVYAIPSYIIVNKDGVIIYNSDENDVNLEKFETYIKSLYN